MIFALSNKKREEWKNLPEAQKTDILLTFYRIVTNLCGSTNSKDQELGLKLAKALVSGKPPEDE